MTNTNVGGYKEGEKDEKHKWILSVFRLFKRMKDEQERKDYCNEGEELKCA